MQHVLVIICLLIMYIVMYYDDCFVFVYGGNLIVYYIECIGTQTFHFVCDNVRFVSTRKGGVRVRASWQARGRGFGMVVSII